MTQGLELTEDLLDDVARATGSDPRLMEELPVGFDAGQRMRQSAVTPIDLGCLDEAFLQVR